MKLISFNFKMLDEPVMIKHLTSFVVQDARIFADFVQNLHQYNEDSSELKIFDRNYKSLKASELLLITDILGHDVNSTSVLQQVYKDLELQISAEPENKTKIEELLAELIVLINKEMLEFEIDLESEHPGLIDLLKVMKIKIEIQTDTIFERIIEIIQVFKYLSKKRLLIFVNVGTYLTESEIESLEEYIMLQNIPVLLVDRNDFSGVEKQVVLDEDFVILTSNLG